MKNFIVTYLSDAGRIVTTTVTAEDRDGAYSAAYEADAGNYGNDCINKIVMVEEQ